MVAAVVEAVVTSVFAAAVLLEATGVVQLGFAVVLGLVLGLVDVSVVYCGVVSRKDEVSGRHLLLRYAYFCAPRLLGRLQSMYRLIDVGAGTWLGYGRCMQRTTEGKLASVADRVRVVRYTPLLYTIRTQQLLICSRPALAA